MNFPQSNPLWNPDHQCKWIACLAFDDYWIQVINSNCAKPSRLCGPLDREGKRVYTVSLIVNFFSKKKKPSANKRLARVPIYMLVLKSVICYTSDPVSPFYSTASTIVACYVLCNCFSCQEALRNGEAHDTGDDGASWHKNIA